MLLALTLLACTGAKDVATDDTAVSVDLPPAGPLQVGVARVRMPVPVGIGTVGYGGFDIAAEPSPFAELYPATEHIHQHPDFRAVVLSRGPGHEVVFLRTDTVAVFQQLRQAVVIELESRLGREMDDALVIGATHTHSGPGRVVDAGALYDLLADRFFPEHYDRMVDAMADAVEQAYADLAPGRVGFGWSDCTAAISDRRCEDGSDHVNGQVPVIGVEQEGTLEAVVLALPVHGTGLRIDQLTLSQDVSGAVEAAIEDRFDHDVEVLMLNGWAGDMSLGEPDVPTREGAELPDGYEQMAEVGQAAADAVEIVLPTLAWEDEPTLHLETHRVVLDRAALAYPEGEFLHEDGAVYCGLGTEADCDPATTIDDLDQQCIWFPTDYPAPKQTELTVGTVGPLHVVTFPGEATTEVGETLVTRLQSELGVSDVMFVGYSQDYLGYALLEDDWWQGGYEASGTLWGPRQGGYLVDQSVRASAIALGVERGGRGVDPVEPFTSGDFVPYAPTTPRAPGTIVADVPEVVGSTDVITLTVQGQDPWLGAPVAVLQQGDGSPVLRPNGAPIDSDGASFWVSLAVDPPYADGLEVAERAFLWTFHVPVQSPVVGHGPALSGDVRLQVTLADGTVVTSGVVTIAE